ncbi:MAG: glycosyltransferase family 2 protein [Candidatus Saccharimonadales bacterium]
MPLLSAVIACYKDEEAIPLMHQQLSTAFELANVQGEIIFVNDGSPDNSLLVLKTLATVDPRVVVVTHSRTFGSQAAFTSGMKIARGDAVVLLDGDLQDPPAIIPAFVQKWREGYDVVYGVRTKRDVGNLLGLAYKAFYRIFRSAAYVPMPIDAGDFSLLDRKVVDAINSLPENNRFLRGLRAWVGFSQTGVEYFRPSRPFGRSTNSWIKNFAWARKAIWSFSYAPLELITVMSLLVIALATVGIIVELVLHIVNPHLVPGTLGILLVVILFLGGVQLLGLSIIGSYLAHIYDEVKRRPNYIVESIFRHSPPPDDTESGDPY